MSQDGINNVIGKRSLFVSRIPSLFLLQRLNRSMSSNVHDFNIETRCCKQVFFPLQGTAPKETLTILEKNIRGTCIIVCYRQKLGGPVYVGIFSTTQNSDLPGDYLSNSRANLGRPRAGFQLNRELSDWASHVSGVGPPFMKIWTCRSSLQSGS
jgi:hypothetical protein